MEDSSRRDSGSPSDLTPAQEERRRAILAAAERLFAEGRFDEVLMDDVAAEAGVAKGTIYQYFADKESLYLTVLTEGFGELQRQLRDEVSSPDPEDRLEHPVADSARYPQFAARWNGAQRTARTAAPLLGSSTAEVTTPHLSPWSPAQARRAGVI